MRYNLLPFLMVSILLYNACFLSLTSLFQNTLTKQNKNIFQDSNIAICILHLKILRFARENHCTGYFKLSRLQLINLFAWVRIVCAYASEYQGLLLLLCTIWCSLVSVLALNLHNNNIYLVRVLTSVFIWLNERYSENFESVRKGPRRRSNSASP